MAADWKDMTLTPSEPRRPWFFWILTAVGSVIAGIVALSVIVLVIVLLVWAPWRNVDKNSYVKHNENALKAIPMFDGAFLVNRFSLGQPIGPNDNGPPYRSYLTHYVFEAPGATCSRVLTWYGNRMPQLGWTLLDSTDSATLFTRGNSELTVVCTGGRSWELRMDYKGLTAPTTRP